MAVTTTAWRAIIFVVALLLALCSGADPVITVGFIATTFTTDDTGAIRRNDAGAQHLAAFMLAVDEINLLHEFSVTLRPELSLGNVDYLKPIQNPPYDGAAAARDIILSAVLPQVVIVTDTSTKALSAATVLQTLGVPTIFTSDRSSALSHASVYSEVLRMSASESHDGAIVRRICRHYGWARVAVLYSEDEFGVDTFFVFRTQVIDGDTGGAIELLAAESFPKHQKQLTNEVASLEASGATIFLAFVSKASSLALFLVLGYRKGLFSTGTQVVVVCKESNANVLAEVRAALLPSESIDDVLRGLLSVQFYPEQHLSTVPGQDFVRRFRNSPTPTRTVDTNGVSQCSTAAQSAALSGYPLYKTPSTQFDGTVIPEVCTGIASFADVNMDPTILLTYDATLAAAKALHYLFSAEQLTETSPNLNNRLYEVLVTDVTRRLSIKGATGTLKWYRGYAKAENFGQGERTTGHSYKILNYFPASLLASTGVNVDDGLAFVGFFNGTRDLSADSAEFIRVASASSQEGQDVVVLCVKDDTTDGLPCQNARYRTADTTSPPLDMRPALHVYAAPASLRAVVAAFGAASAAASLFCLATLFLFRGHHLVKYTQPSVLGLVFAGYLVLSVKVLASQSAVSPGYCVGDKWVGHVGFSLAFIPLVVKLWRLDKILSGKSLKKVKITDCDAVKICLYALLCLILLLALDSVVASVVSPLGFVRSQRSLVANQYTYTYFCGLSDHPASLALTSCIYALQCAIMAKAMVFLWKTRQLPPSVNEVGTITPMVLSVTLLVVVTATIVGVVDFRPHVSALIVNLACAFGVLVSVNYYWAPKCSAIFWDHHEKKIAASAEAAAGGASSVLSSHSLSTAGGWGSGKKTGWGAIKDNIKVGGATVEQNIKRAALLQQLRQQQLPMPANAVQEDIVTGLVGIQGSTLRAQFCQSQISYLQTLIVALAQMSDASGGSGSGVLTPNQNSSIGETSQNNKSSTTAENTATDDSAAPLTEKEKPGAVSLTATTAMTATSPYAIPEERRGGKDGNGPMEV